MSAIEIDNKTCARPPRGLTAAALLTVIFVPLLLTWAMAPAASEAARISAADLDYRGAFLLPAQVSEEATFAYGGTALAYNPKRDSLFAVGHDWYQLTAEVSIPQPRISSRLRDLGRGRFLQPFADATNGRIGSPTDNKIGGQLVYRGRLFGTTFVFYDASGDQVRSHWERPGTSLADGTAAGLYRVGNVGAGYVSGYMTEVPRAWRRALGGPVLTGNCCIPIVSRTSLGPAAFSFDPARLGGSRTPATPLVYYTEAHATLGAWDATWDPAHGTLFNGSTAIRGVVFPKGTRSVLFFGKQGTGSFCYGVGTDDRSLAGEPTPDGSVWCYDPDDASHGTHAYPYIAAVWAYDAAQLRDVRKGRKRPWEVKPYATWKLHLPFGSSQIGGAAYDPRLGLIYLSQQFANGDEPVIHVYDVSGIR